MKICLSVVIVACAGALWCGCAAAPPRQAASAKTNQPPAISTNAAAAQPAEEEAEPVETLPSGKGNPEALAHFAAGESFEAEALAHSSAGESFEARGQREQAIGESAEARRLHEQAMEEFYKSVMADPGNEKTARDVAQWLLDQHHPERAVTLLSKVAGRPDVSAPILGLLARADLQAGKTNAALEASRKAVARRPDSLESYEGELAVFVQTGKMAEALKTLDQAAKHIRNTPADLIALAGLYAACQGPQEKANDPVRLRAVALLDRAAAMNFSAQPLWQRMADVYARLNELKKATDIYNRLLTQAVDSATLRNLLRERLGEILLDSHDATNAAAQFQAVVQNDPVNFKAWYFLGILAHSEGRLADAVEDFQRAISAAPGMELAYYRLALVLADQRRGDAALQILDRARLSFPDSFDAQFFNALVNFQLKDFDQAVSHFTAAETMARSNNPARLDRQFYFQLGAACERAHQYKRAEGYLQKCIDMGPDDAEALNYLGFMWADRGEQLPKARAYIEKACKLEPNNAAYLDSLGWVLFKLNQPQAALPWLVKAVDLSSAEPDATILDHLGDVYLSLHQLGKAMENWKKSLAIEPNEEIMKKLRSVDGGAT
jgi:tetratricopeptide (TPR) repeat protein